MGFGSLSIATSGIRVAQTNLAITGHNVSNAEIPGYSRQRTIQQTSFTRSIGQNNAGDRFLIQHGVNWNAVHQIRNEFLDFSYRQNVGRLAFHSTRVNVGLHIETLLGELHGGYNFQGVLNDMWFAIQELSGHPDGIETRTMLLATANAFLAKAQAVYQGLIEYQYNLDAQIRQMVGEVNDTIAEINRLNKIIRQHEASGDNANDFRDDRNRQLDRLAEMIPIYTFIDAFGDVGIMSGGHQLLNGGVQNRLGLRFISDTHSFVEPVVTNTTGILSAGSHPSTFGNFVNHSRGIGEAQGNDFGQLNALLVARGTTPVTRVSGDIPHPQDVLNRWEAYLDDTSPYYLTLLINNLNTQIATLNTTTIPGFQGDVTTATTNVGLRLDDMNDARYDRDAQLIVIAGLTPSTPAYEAAVAQLLIYEQALADATQDYYDAQAALATAQANLQAAITERDDAEARRDEAIDIRDNIATDRIAFLEENLAADIHNWNAMQWSLRHAKIPRIMQNLDRIVFSVVKMINDMLTGNLRGADGELLFPGYTPVSLDEDFNEGRGIPLFVRRFYDGSTEWDGWANMSNMWDSEDPGRLLSVFTISNLMINPAFGEQGGHNRLALNLTQAPGDNRLLLEMLDVWQSNQGPYAINIGAEGRYFSVQDAYIAFTATISADIAEANSKTSSLTIQVQQAQALRLSIKGVSMDEELNAMLRFQFAFQSASRVFNVIDSMIETVLGIGR